MNISMSDFRVVDPGCSAFSAAETRISRTSIRLSSLAAAELNYPNYVRIIIGDPIPFFGIVPCDINDRFACPFMLGKTADDLRGQKKWIVIKNRAVATILRAKMSCENDKATKRVYGSKWTEENALLFGLSKPAETGKRTAMRSAEEMLRSYALATVGVNAQIIATGFVPHFYSVPNEQVINERVIDAEFVQVR